MFDDYDYQEDDDSEVYKKTETIQDSLEHQKSSRRSGNTRRDKERQKKQSRDRHDFYEDRWN
jgi:hypothetical protein